MKAVATLAALALAIQLQAQAPLRTQAFSLPNGLRVVLLEDHERPLVRARLHLPLEPGLETMRPGLGALARRMLSRSDAGNLKVEEFHQILARAGIELAPSLGADGLSWNLVARSRDQDLALGLLADRVLRPLFEPATLETERLACWRDIERLAVSPQGKLRLALEPDWTLRVPSLDSLKAVTFEDLQAFFVRVSRPDRAVLILHGDLGKEQAMRLVFQTFGTWTTQPAPDLHAPAAPPPADRVQVPASGNLPWALAVAAAPPDLGPESRALLALLLAEEPVLPPAQLRVEGSDLVASLEGLPGSDAGALLMDRLQTLRQRGFTESDLRRARAAWSAGSALVALHPGAVMDQAVAEARQLAATPARMEALTVEALNDGLHRWLDPARIRAGALTAPAR